jgi:hypothetical protein
VDQKRNKEVNMLTLDDFAGKNTLSQEEIDLFISLFRAAEEEAKKSQDSSIDGIILKEGDYNEGQ